MCLLSSNYRHLIHSVCKRSVCDQPFCKSNHQRQFSKKFSKLSNFKLVDLQKMATNASDEVVGELDAMLSTLGLDGRYFMVDIGANLTNKKYSRDLEHVIQRAKDSG